MLFVSRKWHLISMVLFANKIHTHTQEHKPNKNVIHLYSFYFRNRDKNIYGKRTKKNK